ncbi:MAG: hypothetical protein J5613_03900 [Alphaproteobacteria bacterium]|nr:hypothetical protein [Alphaproteobacteria bacterium]
MNIKILGLLGILAIATVPCAPYTAFAEEVDELDEDFDEEFDEEFDEDDFFDDEEDEGEEIVAEEVATVPETRTVKARETCADINKRVNELRADVAAHPELKEELDALLVRQRQCAPRANRRPVRNYDNVNPVFTVDVAPIEEVTPEPVEVAPVKKPEKKKSQAEIEAEQAEQLRQAEENRAKGLCGDGAKPNKFGCCAGEKFKEVSQMVFACCSKDNADNCHEPLKKK